VGGLVTAAVGVALVGNAVGLDVGVEVEGADVGSFVGLVVTGLRVGVIEGLPVGVQVGSGVGMFEVGCLVLGTDEGYLVGFTVTGTLDGADGDEVSLVGEYVGNMGESDGKDEEAIVKQGQKRTRGGVGNTLSIIALGFC